MFYLWFLYVSVAVAAVSEKVAVVVVVAIHVVAIHVVAIHVVAIHVVAIHVVAIHVVAVVVAGIGTIGWLVGFFGSYSYTNGMLFNLRGVNRNMQYKKEIDKEKQIMEETIAKKG